MEEVLIEEDRSVDEIVAATISSLQRDIDQARNALKKINKVVSSYENDLKIYRILLDEISERVNQ